MKKDSSLDLLERLNSNSFPDYNSNPVKTNHHPDLNLSLSLNGWDPQSNDKNRLSRACSSVVIPEVVDVELSLSRTCSLVDEGEWRKRKEMQMLRRSEVKRRRCHQKMKKKQSPPLPEKKQLVRFSSSDGSSSQGCGSSGLSDQDTPQLSTSGTNRDSGGTNEPSNANKVQGNPKTATNEKVQGNPKITPNGHSVIDQTMPCVSTKEEGPDGKRIQGFLYRYGKGQEVRIVCVCHGSFLTPGEFVKHGGGGDVDHPLRHIIVTPLFT